jgi:hypothetical protein
MNKSQCHSLTIVTYAWYSLLSRVIIVPCAELSLAWRQFQLSKFGRHLRMLHSLLQSYEDEIFKNKHDCTLYIVLSEDQIMQVK